MGEFDPVFVESLAHQSWSLYGVGIFLILLRMYARVHRLGIRGLQTDDYLMMLAAGFYTMLIVCLNAIVAGGGSNLYPPEQFVTFTPAEIEERINGSKIVIISEQAMLNVIYTIKACMLYMYTRLTLHHTIHKLVTYLAIYVFVGWIATEIAFFTACRPFSGYWAMPPPDPQCTTLEHYAIVQAVFNISSDTLMLFIPLPLFTKLRVPWKQKIVLVVIFSMGMFVILAAILTKVFNLSDMWSTVYMLWYIREASVAVYVSNLPMIWPLMREWFPILTTWTTGQKASSSKGPTGATRRTRTGALSLGKSRNDTGVITTVIQGKGDSTDQFASTSDTELGIMSEQSWDGGRPSTKDSDIGLVILERDAKHGGIHKSTTVHVREEHVNDPGHSIQLSPPFMGGQTDIEKGERGFEWAFDKGRR